MCHQFYWGKGDKLQCQTDVMMTIMREELPETLIEGHQREEVAITTMIIMMIEDHQDHLLQEIQAAEILEDVQKQITIQIEGDLQADLHQDQDQAKEADLIRKRRAESLYCA